MNLSMQLWRPVFLQPGHERGPSFIREGVGWLRYCRNIRAHGREIRVSESEQALATAREAGMWRLDKRWRHVRPQFDFVEIPPTD